MGFKGFGYWVLGAGFWVLGTGYWVLGTGYGIRGTGLSAFWAGDWFVFTAAAPP